MLATTLAPRQQGLAFKANVGSTQALKASVSVTRRPRRYRGDAGGACSRWPARGPPGLSAATQAPCTAHRPALLSRLPQAVQTRAPVAVGMPLVENRVRVRRGDNGGSALLERKEAAMSVGAGRAAPTRKDEGASALAEEEAD